MRQIVIAIFKLYIFRSIEQSLFYCIVRGLEEYVSDRLSPLKITRVAIIFNKRLMSLQLVDTHFDPLDLDFAILVPRLVAACKVS